MSLNKKSKCLMLGVISLVTIAIVNILILGYYNTFILRVINSHIISTNSDRELDSARQKNILQCSQLYVLLRAVGSKYPAILANPIGTKFQLASGPIDANWRTGSDIEAYNLANSISSTVSDYYTPTPGSFYNTYTEFVMSLSPVVDFNIDNRYMKLSQRKKQEQIKLVRALSRAQAVWKKNETQRDGSQVSLNQTVKANWLSDPLGGKRYGVEIEKHEENILELSKQIAAVKASLNKPLMVAKQRLSAIENRSNYLKKDGQIVKLPTITIGGDLGGDLSNWSKQQRYDLDVTITGSVIQELHSKGNGFEACSTEIASSVVNSSALYFDEHFSLRVMLKGFKAYPITYGNWFSSSLLTANLIYSSPYLSENNNRFFSRKNGALRLVPSLIWVMYQPKFELVVGNKTFKKIMNKEFLSEDSWFNLLSFSFNASLIDKQVGEATTTLTFNSPTLQSPQIFGVTSIVTYTEPNVGRLVEPNPK